MNIAASHKFFEIKRLSQIQDILYPSCLTEIEMNVIRDHKDVIKLAPAWRVSA